MVLILLLSILGHDFHQHIKRDVLSPYYFSLGESNWLIVATGVADCYYNVTDLTCGATYRFRVACVNKAGQGPYSNLSEKVTLDAAGTFYSALLYFAIL